MNLALRVFAICLLVVLTVGSAHPVVRFPDQRSPTQTCSAPEYHQFDFWLGDWDAFDVGPGDSSGHVKVESLLEGCVLREDYEGSDGHKGESFTIYDISRRVWHQTWVTNRGELLTIEGNFKNGEMVLSGVELTADGKRKLIRGTWKPEGQRVRETAVTSIDGGKSWKLWFDLQFLPHK
jgi:hypothetical protein